MTIKANIPAVQDERFCNEEAFVRQRGYFLSWYSEIRRTVNAYVWNVSVAQIRLDLE